MATTSTEQSNDIDLKLAFLHSNLSMANPMGPRDLLNEMKKKFGSAMTFTNFHKIRAAFGSPSFEPTARKILSTTGKGATKKAAKKTAKPAAKKIAKKIAKKAAKKAVVMAAPAAEVSEPAPSAKKGRGERRTKVERRGRRKEDRHFVSLQDAPKHLVLVDNEGEVTDFRFANKNDAKNCIRDHLMRGISARKILYYERSEYSFDISL